MDLGVPASSPAAIGHHNNFDFLRFVLATAVVFAHSFLVFGDRHTHTGQIAVMGFFGISGFLVIQSWQRKRSVLDYFRKRVLRIYPGFASACLFDYFIVAPIATGAGLRYLGRIDPVGIVSQIVLLRHTFIRGIFSDLPAKSVNISLWTVPFEFACYIGLAVLGAIGFTGRRSRLLALTVVVWGLYVVVPVVVPGRLLPRADARNVELALRFGCCFLVGAVFYLFRERIAMTGVAFWSAVFLLVASIWDATLFRLVWPIGFPYVLIWIALEPRIPLQDWGKLGDFSYGIYIYAFPIQQLLVKFYGSLLNPYTLFVAAMLLTLPVAVCSWHFIERPFLRLKNRSNLARDPQQTHAN